MRTIVAAVIIAVVIGITWGAWSMYTNMVAPAATSTSKNVSIPPFSTSPGQTFTGGQQPAQGTGQPGQGQTPPPVLQVASPQDPVVVNDFKNQIQNASLITLGGTIVSQPYALQVWGDENKGGEALLRYATSTGWTLLSLGGGLWTVSGLVEAGVPQDIATQLVAGLGQ